ncbi:hypothetical protein EDB19DRAFT_1637085, partial [Suillus lakei]
WFEEDGTGFCVHPKDPYKRVDVLQFSRQTRIALDGVELASTNCPCFLFETGLPVRTYMPLTDIRVDILWPSHTITE